MANRDQLDGQHVVVVGGASGIGLAVAKASARLGARLTLIGRTVERLREAAGEVAGAQVRVADARDAGALSKTIASLVPIDHLVTTTSQSSARLGVATTMAAMSEDAARAFFDGKFWAQYQCAKAALPHLADHGSIVFTSGVAVRRSLPGHTIIAANNAAIEAAARQLAKEIGPRRVNVVSPGLTSTGAYDHLGRDERAALLERITAGQPIPRPADPGEIADAFVFAMTSSYLTGAVIDIDGGFLVQ